MSVIRLICFILSCSFAGASLAAEAATTVAPQAPETVTTPLTEPTPLSALCKTRLSSLIGPFDKTQIEPLCAEVKTLDTCKSFKGEPIFHYEKVGTGTPNSSHPAPKKVLVFSLIHGDEFGAGSVARAWMFRLRTIDPRNTWRMIPLVNPDGLTLKTRTNARKVDLNRNFPSNDWEENALAYWKKDQKSAPRRYPG
ncbi:MAG: succinylglutamate desuccinylase/aspartoacylase family protein, partial [Bdellovibrionota bacterium]